MRVREGEIWVIDISGISVAAVIHSPSQATFEKFDDLTLLGAGVRNGLGLRLFLGLHHIQRRI